MKYQKVSILMLALLSLSILFSSCDKDNDSDEAAEHGSVEDFYLKVGDQAHIDVYQALEPNVILPSTDVPNSYYLDVNDDGTTDIGFIYESVEGNHENSQKTYVKRMNEAFHLIIKDSDIKVCDLNEELDLQADFTEGFQADQEYLLAYDYHKAEPYQVDATTWACKDSCYHDGAWRHIESKYMVFKFPMDNYWHMGWIKLGFIEMEQDQVLKILDYAYKKIKNAKIE